MGPLNRNLRTTSRRPHRLLTNSDIVELIIKIFSNPTIIAHVTRESLANVLYYNIIGFGSRCEIEKRRATAGS
jgi:hypothetical protein